MATLRSGRQTEAEPGPIPVVVDTDAGIDDAVALLFVLAHPALDVRAVSCVVGNVALDQAVRNVRALVDLARPDDPIPVVASGSAQPLRGARPITGYHGELGFGHARLPDGTRPVDPHGVELLVRMARDNPGELTLLALGPLTNVALAVLVEPRLPSLLRSVVVMGGAFEVPGNEGPRSEFNIDVDPEAAQIVFHAWEGADAATPLTLVGLDVTRQALLRSEDVATIVRADGLDYPDADATSLSGRAGHPVSQFLIDSLRYSSESSRRSGGPYAAIVHDALAAVALVDTQVLVTRPATVDVETAGQLTRGETVADWTGAWGRPRNAQVAVGCDVDRFREVLTSTLANLVRR